MGSWAGRSSRRCSSEEPSGSLCTRCCLGAVGSGVYLPARRRSGVGRGRAVLDGAARGVPDPGRRVADRADPDRRRHRVPHHGGGEIPCCTPQAGARSRGETVGGAPTPTRRRSRSSAERRAALLAGARPRARARRVRPGRTTPASCGPARATVSVRAGSRVAVGCGIASGLCHVITLRVSHPRSLSAIPSRAGTCSREPRGRRRWCPPGRAAPAPGPGDRSGGADAPAAARPE